MVSVFYGFETLNLNTMITKEKILRILDKYANDNFGINSTYIDHVDFDELADELVKNCSIPGVVERSEQLVCDCGNSSMTWYGNDDDKKWFCFNCKKEAN